MLRTGLDVAVHYCVIVQVLQRTKNAARDRRNDALRYGTKADTGKELASRSVLTKLQSNANLLKGVLSER